MCGVVKTVIINYMFSPVPLKKCLVKKYLVHVAVVVYPGVTPAIFATFSGSSCARLRLVTQIRSYSRAVRPGVAKIFSYASDTKSSKLFTRYVSFV